MLGLKQSVSPVIASANVSRCQPAPVLGFGHLPISRLYMQTRLASLKAALLPSLPFHFRLFNSTSSSQRDMSDDTGRGEQP